MPVSNQRTRRIATDDPGSGFKCGEPALDAFFARHALRNDHDGIGNTFVLPGAGSPEEPAVLGFYTLSMADMERGRIDTLLTDITSKLFVPMESVRSALGAP